MGFLNHMEKLIVKRRFQISQAEMSARMVTETTTKIVYLDQKCWIDIAKLYYGQPTKEEKKLIERIFQSSEKGQLISPLSISHLEETMKIANSRRKSQLAFLMAKLSQGYALQPYVDRVIDAEIENIVLRKVELPTQNIRNFVLKKGVSHLVGAKPELVFKKGSPTSEDKQKMEKLASDLLEDPQTIEILLKQSLPKSIGQGLEKPIEEMEKNRQELRKIKDNNKRKNAFFAINICNFLVPKLAKISIEYNLPKHFFIRKKPTRSEVYRFLDSIPTALCFFTLIFQRDQQFQRPIPKNDFHDIWFLTLAIPYCDIVVTEKMWTTIARQTKLDAKCNTIVLSSISELWKYV